MSPFTEYKKKTVKGGGHVQNESQVIKWGIPGWIFILTISWYDYLSNNFQMYYKIDSYLAATILLLTVMGIPIGYLIYQIYFFFRWQFDAKTVPYDVWPFAPPYSKWKDPGNHKQDWLYVEVEWHKVILLLQACESKCGLIVLERYKHLLRMFHGMGASIWSVSLGAVIGLLRYLYSNNCECSWLIISLLVNAVIVISLVFNWIYIRNNVNYFMNGVFKNYVSWIKETKNIKKQQIMC